MKLALKVNTFTNNSPNDISHNRVSYYTDQGNIEDSCYAEIEVKHVTNNRNSTDDATNISSMDDDKIDFQDISQLYAVVDKSAKVRKPLQVDANEDSYVNYQGTKFEFEDVTDLYAVVDKSAKKRKAKEQDLSELYAVVDKSNMK